MGNESVTVTAPGGGNNSDACTPIHTSSPDGWMTLWATHTGGSGGFEVQFDVTGGMSTFVPNQFSFGDGTFAPFANTAARNCVKHTYASAGTYTAQFALDNRAVNYRNVIVTVPASPAGGNPPMGGICTDPCANHMCVISPPFKCDGTPPAGWCMFNGYAYPNGHAYIDGGVVMNPPRPRPPGNRCSNGTWIYDPNVPIAA